MPNINPNINKTTESSTVVDQNRNRVMILILAIFIIAIYGVVFVIYNYSKKVEPTVNVSDVDPILAAINANARQDVSMEESLNILDKINQINKAN